MTSNVHNRGIAHLSFRLGGTPFCKARRAHVVVTVINTMGYQICKRCAAKAEKMQAGKLNTEKADGSPDAQGS